MLLREPGAVRGDIGRSRPELRVRRGDACFGGLDRLGCGGLLRAQPLRFAASLAGIFSSRAVSASAEACSARACRSASSSADACGSAGPLAAISGANSSGRKNRLIA